MPRGRSGRQNGEAGAETAPKRAEPVREPKSGKSKPERPKNELRAARVRQSASAGIPRTAGPQKIIEELQRRLDESLQQQTATADFLKVISHSAFDLQIVLETLVKSAMALCDAHTGAIFQKLGDLYHNDRRPGLLARDADLRP